MPYRPIFIFAAICIFLPAALTAQGTRQKKFPPLLAKESRWRGVFTLRSGAEVPFNFLLRPDTDGASKIVLLNAEEQLEGGKVTQHDDSLFVQLDQFENELAFGYQNNLLTGVLRRQDKSGTPIPVVAEMNVTGRFPETTKAPEGDISGTYDITFTQPGGRQYKAVGLFAQTGKKLKATFLKVAGDSRYLEGIVEGNEFYLSSFIGASPVYYKGSFTKDRTLNGELAGISSSQSFAGTPNENAALPDPYKLTYIKDGYSEFNFSFPDINGKPVSLKDEKFRDKVVVVTIGGTWCPNCMDETAFLAPWYQENKGRGVEVISLQYELQTDPAYINKIIPRYRDRFNVQYTQLIAGIADKQAVAESLPALNTFLSFPTTIFIGRDGKVARIHTGFSGPATGKYYEAFKKDFEEEISSLLNKK